LEIGCLSQKTKMKFLFVLCIAVTLAAAAKTCPAPKPARDIEVEVDLPRNHLRGGREIKKGLDSLDKSLDLLAYALQIKGIKVEASCVESHTVNTEPFKFPKVVTYQETWPPQVTTAVPEPSVGETLVAGTPEPEPEATTTEAEVTVSPDPFTWIHDSSPETPVPETAEPDTKKHDIHWFREQCRLHPKNSYLCNAKLREQTAEKKKAHKKGKLTELEAANHDVFYLEKKMMVVGAVRKRLEAEILKLADEGVTMTPANQKILRKKHIAVLHKVVKLKKMLKKAKARQAKAKAAEDKLGMPEPETTPEPEPTA